MLIFLHHIAIVVFQLLLLTVSRFLFFFSRCRLTASWCFFPTFLKETQVKSRLGCVPFPGGLKVDILSFLFPCPGGECVVHAALLKKMVSGRGGM